MITISRYQYAHCGHEITVIHRGIDPGDVIEVTAPTQLDAINKILEIRKLNDISELVPQAIETTCS